MTIAASLLNRHVSRVVAHPGEVRAFLDHDAAYGAAALCLLEQVPELCVGHLVVNRAGQDRALVLVVRDAPAPRVFTMGDAEAVYYGLASWERASAATPQGPTALVERNERSHAGTLPAARAALTMEPGHVRHIARLYRLGEQRALLRLVATPETFRPATLQHRAIQLGRGHLPALARLYALAGNPVLEEGMLDSGAYYGIEEHGMLVAAAGTHLLAMGAGIAIVGNVFTHPDFRGRGYAQAVTGAVTAHLLEYIRGHGAGTRVWVALDAMAGNTPAVAAYQHLGYQVRSHFIEADGWRRGLSRWLARAADRA